MLLNDLLHDCQPKAGPLPLFAHMLGGMEGIEYMVQVGRRNTTAGIANLDLDPSPPIGLVQRMGPYGKSVSISHRVQGIHKEVQENLLYLLAIKHNRCQIFGEFLFNTDRAVIRADFNEIKEEGANFIKFFFLKLRLPFLALARISLINRFNPATVSDPDAL